MKIIAKIINTQPKEFEYDSDKLGKRLTTINSKHRRCAIIVVRPEYSATRLSIHKDRIHKWRDYLIDEKNVSHYISRNKNTISVKLYNESYWTNYEFPTENDAIEWWNKYIKVFDQKIIEPNLL